MILNGKNMVRDVLETTSALVVENVFDLITRP